MSRQCIDCLEFPSTLNCSVALAADSDKELLETAVQHAVAVHGRTDTPELRKQLASMFKPATPPLKVAQATLASA